MEQSREESLDRFESRFGNIEEFKRKVLLEHMKSCNHSSHCLECKMGGVKQRKIRPSEMRLT